MKLNDIKIEKKKIYDELSWEDINDRRIFGGKPTGIINFSKVKYQWAYELYDLMKALFVESNPVPMKEALTMMGKPSGDLRLPLVPLLDEDREILRKALKDANLI